MSKKKAVQEGTADAPQTRTYQRRSFAAKVGQLNARIEKAKKRLADLESKRDALIEAEKKRLASESDALQDALDGYIPE